MSKKIIEDVIKNVLKGDAQKNALELIAHIRANEDAGKFSISMYDDENESAWGGLTVSNLGYIVVTGSDDFPGPWTMWMEADNLGEGLETLADENLKEFAWSHVSPCGNCGAHGGQCAPGKHTRIFGKDFENTCQANLIFINPNAETVEGMKKIIDVRKNEILQKGIDIDAR